MGLMDKQLQVAASQAFSADAPSTNMIDLGNITAPKRDIGLGETMAFGINVEVAADATSGDETYQFDIIQDAAADGLTADVLCSFVVSRTLLVVGKTLILPIPPGFITKRYLGVAFNGGGNTPTITASIYLAPIRQFEKQMYHASGFTA